MAPGRERSIKRTQACLQALLNVMAGHDSVFSTLAEDAAAMDLLVSFIEPDALRDGNTAPRHAFSRDPLVHRVRELSLQVMLLMSPKCVSATAMANCRCVGSLLMLMRRYNELVVAGTAGDRFVVLDILLALCSTTAAVGILFELGGLIDLLAIFAHRTDSPDSPELGKSRSMCSRILCKTLFDNTHGAQIMLTLCRILPGGLVHEIREDPQGKSSVESFDADHETPELIWTIKTRRTLYDYLAQEERMLQDAALRHECPVWHLQDEFTLRYPSLAMELQSAGVYIRIYLKDPKFSLREPKRFIDETLRMFIGRAEEIVNKLDRSARDREVSAQAKSPAATPHGPMLGDGMSGTKQIVLAETRDRILTPLTSAAICIMRVRESILPHVATLGYGLTLLEILRRITLHSRDSVLGSCCLRLLHQFSNSKSIVQSIAMRSASHANPVATMLATITPMHKDAGFALETMRKMICASSAGDSGRAIASSSVDASALPHADAISNLSSLTADAMDADVGLIAFMISVLDGSAEGMANIGAEDVGVCRVHAVEILHALAANSAHGADVRQRLDAHPVWEEYRHQKHDLFMSRSETARQDYYLTYGPGYGPAGDRKMMLQDAN